MYLGVKSQKCGFTPAHARACVRVQSTLACIRREGDVVGGRAGRARTRASSLAGQVNRSSRKSSDG